MFITFTSLTVSIELPVFSSLKLQHTTRDKRTTNLWTSSTLQTWSIHTQSVYQFTNGMHTYTIRISTDGAAAADNRCLQQTIWALNGYHLMIEISKCQDNKIFKVTTGKEEKKGWTNFYFKKKKPYQTPFCYWI